MVGGKEMKKHTAESIFPPTNFQMMQKVDSRYFDDDYRHVGHEDQDFTLEDAAYALSTMQLFISTEKTCK